MIAGLFVVQSLQLEHEQTPDQQKPTKPATDDDTDAKAASTDDGQRKGEADGMSEGEEAAAAAATTSSPAKSKHIKVRHLHLTDIHVCVCCIFDTLVKSCRIFTACTVFPAKRAFKVIFKLILYWIYTPQCEQNITLWCVSLPKVVPVSRFKTLL